MRATPPARLLRRDRIPEAPAAPAGALALAAAAGIHVIPVATPFEVGPVNAYLIEDDPLTLVDSGPNSALSLYQLESGIRALGHAIEDLDLLLITHPHMDHFGLTDVLVRRSGAEVAALDVAVPHLEDYASQACADNRYAERVMVRHGVAPLVASSLRIASDSATAWGANVHVDRALPDGGEISLRDRTLRMAHRPGHSAADTVLTDHERGIAFTGDHLIKHIASAALIARPLGSPLAYDGPRPRALVDLLTSLRATRATPARLVLTGHGEPVTDHVALIRERLARHERRADQLLALIRARSLTAHEIAVAFWRDAGLTQIFLTMCQVLGHLDLLIQQGRARERDDNGVVRFEAAR